jgi:hypothetical protein
VVQLDNGFPLDTCINGSVVQLDNGFPPGTCINGSVVQDPAFVDLFTNHTDWAVFENELRWYWTEARLNYGDADRLGKPARGHCIFWAVDGAVQKWVRDIGGDRDQLVSAVQDGLLSRYAGRFPHYDVNNEMLQGRFYRDRLGVDVAALRQRLQRRVRQRPQRHAREVHRAHRRRRAGRRHRDPGTRQQPRHLRRARHHRPAHLDHGARRRRAGLPTTWMVIVSCFLKIKSWEYTLQNFHCLKLNA